MTSAKNNPPPRIINERSRESERGRYITPPAHLVGKMRDYDFAKDSGIKASHHWAFTQTCNSLNVILLVRATNKESIRWIEEKGYTPKPIDCKAKTAELDSDSNELQYVKCAGLVVSPIVLGWKVFKNKQEKARKAWDSFNKSLISKKLSSGVQVWLRHQAKGFYNVNTDQSSFHYGCLMVSDQMPPDDFDPSKSHSRKWMEINMSYIHGDYDLYGIIDWSQAGAMTPGYVHEVAKHTGTLLGQKSYTTKQSEEVAKSINKLIGTDMVQHGEQSALNHEADKGVYIFYPDGNIQVVAGSQFKHPTEMENYFQDLYRYVFKTAYVDQEEGVRQRTKN